MCVVFCHTDKYDLSSTGTYSGVLFAPCTNYLLIYVFVCWFMYVFVMLECVIIFSRDYVYCCLKSSCSVCFLWMKGHFCFHTCGSCLSCIQNFSFLSFLSCVFLVVFLSGVFLLPADWPVCFPELPFPVFEITGSVLVVVGRALIKLNQNPAPMTDITQFKTA